MFHTFSMRMHIYFFQQYDVQYQYAVIRLGYCNGAKTKFSMGLHSDDGTVHMVMVIKFNSQMSKMQ